MWHLTFNIHHPASFEQYEYEVWNLDTVHRVRHTRVMFWWILNRLMLLTFDAIKIPLFNLLIIIQLNWIYHLRSHYLARLKITFSNLNYIYCSKVFVKNTFILWYRFWFADCTKWTSLGSENLSHCRRLIRIQNGTPFQECFVLISKLQMQIWNVKLMRRIKFV